MTKINVLRDIRRMTVNAANWISLYGFPFNKLCAALAHLFLYGVTDKKCKIKYNKKCFNILFINGRNKCTNLVYNMRQL